MRAKSTYLYLATDGKAHKIGIASDVHVRRYTLQLDNKRPVRMLRSWHRPRDAQAIETIIKHHFSDQVCQGREWFTASKDEILFQINRIVKIHDQYHADRFKRAKRVKALRVSISTIYANFQVSRDGEKVVIKRRKKTG